MNVLIVCAHFDARSFNAALLEAGVKQFEALGHEVRVSDLYAMKFQPVTLPEDFSDPANPGHIRYDAEQRHAVANGTLPADVQAELEKIAWCDLLILQFPWYWFGLPAIMKGWVDRVFAMDVAYGGGKWYDRGAFSGKKAMLNFSTGCFPSMCGPDGINGEMEIILWPIQNGILRFTGFDVLAPQISYSVNYRDDAARKAMLDDWACRIKDLFDEIPMPFNGRDDYGKDWRMKPGISPLAVGQMRAAPAGDHTGAARTAGTEAVTNSA